MMDYKNLVLQNPFIGYAYHKIITDSNNNPIDYKFIEVNEQYEHLTGLKADQIIGKTIVEVLAGIKDEKFSWIDFFGNVALTGKSDKAVQYVDGLNRWYSVAASSPKKGFFVATFFDITEQEKQKQGLKETNRILNGIRKINSIQIVASDPKELIEDICYDLVHEFGFDSAMINLFDKGKHVGAQEKYTTNFEELKSFFKSGKTLYCFEKAKKENDAIFMYNTECQSCLLHDSESKNVFVVPIKHQRRILGYINIKQKKESTNIDSHLDLLKEIGNEIALVLIKIKLEQEQERYIREIAHRENRLTSILQSSPIGIAHLKNDKLIDVNQKFSIIAGLPVSQLVGISLKHFFANPSEYNEVKKSIESNLNKSEAREFEVKWKKDNSMCIDVLLTFAIINPRNIKEGFSITVEDITARKKDRLIKSILLNISKESNKTDNTEQLAPTIREELGKLFSTENFYIALYNADQDMYSFPFHNDKFEHEYVESDKLYDLSGSLTDLVRKEKRAFLINKETEKELIKSGKTKHIGVESPVWMAAPFIDSGKNSFGVIAVQHYEDKNAYTEEDLEILDNVAHYLSKIYEKKNADKKLRESEEKYRQLIENSGEGVINVDLNENILLINNAGAKIFGVEKEKLLGVNLSEFFSPEQFESIKSQTKLRLQGKKSIYELIVSNKKGAKRNILLTATPIYKNNVIVANLGVFRDITVQKRSEILLKKTNEELQAAEEELRASNDELKFVNDELEKRNQELIIAKEKAESADRLKSAFLANMSHEIRTPMNSILGFSELLKNEGFSKEKRNHFIDIINQNGEQLVSIITDIVDFSKIEANQLDLHYSKVDLAELFRDIFFTFNVHQGLVNKNMKLKLELPPGKQVIINTDSIRIKQVLSNLVGNAIKFTHEGEIILGFKSDNEKVICFVKDTGIGIHKEKQEVIFERFRQADDSRTRKYGGTGLGLTISKRIVELLGGEMWVESQPDEGSQFYFLLKL